MSKEEHIAYLDQMNRELVRELHRYDILITGMRVSLSIQKKALKLLNELQQNIAIAESEHAFYWKVSELVSRHLEMTACKIGLSDHQNPGSVVLMDNNEVLDVSGLEDIKRPFILKSGDKRLSGQEEISRKLGLASMLYFPLLHNKEIKLLIITGRASVDHAMKQDVNEEDLSTLEAVGTLITSYWSKSELIKLHETDRIKTEFVSNLSHEFRTPLTLVLGLLDEMKNSLLPIMDDREKESFEVVYQNAIRIKELIHQLLDISQLENSPDRLQVTRGDLAQWTGKLAATYATLARKKGIHFKYTINSSVEESWYDADKLEKIISNLLSNAMKYTDRNGEVNLTLETKESKGTAMAFFEISDTGQGIPESEQENIFQRFYRLNHDGKSSTEGTGVGLYLVKVLTELHLGKVEVHSEPGEGSLFRIGIPLSREIYKDDAVKPELPEKRAHIEPGQSALENDRALVLIVEDNHDLNLFLKTNLEKHFNVLTAHEGKEGLELARKEIPDLVISDVMMPVMNGVEMSKRLKEDLLTGHIPVLMLTAKVDRDSKIEGLDSGAEDYLSKPFDMEELILKVRNHLDTAKKIRNNYHSLLIENPEVTDVHTPEDQFIKRLVELMKRNLADPDYQLDGMCRDLGISRSQLYRKIGQLAGMKPGELFRNLRLNTAAEYFRSGQNNITQVMYRVGFNNLSNFAQSFKKRFGANPSQYIKNVH
ncbi:MAG: response regulator [Bacteroidales bacterium]|nr:response regulator [Bacteroidales bacterium]